MSIEDQLRNLHAAGFEPITLERYPGYFGVVRDGFVALLRPEGERLGLFSAPGRLLGGDYGVLVQHGRETGFRAKTQWEPAGPELIESFERFRRDLAQALG